MGIVPPTETDFLIVYPTPVSNPSSGVIVLPEIPVISAETGEPIECPADDEVQWPERFMQHELTEALQQDTFSQPTEASPKKSRKKKE